MSEIDIGAHTISAGGGALAYGIVDRIIRFFRERDREKAEGKLIERLSAIEGRLTAIADTVSQFAALTEQLTDVRVRLARLEGIEEGRRQVAHS